MRVRLPLFVLLEGIDGSGKSTLADRVTRHFLDAGVPSLRLAEPTDGEWGRRIRAHLRAGDLPSPEEQLELFIEDRADDVARNIKPALAAGKLVVMDRYYYSNAAYQGAAGIPPERVIAANRARGFPDPDRVYLIDIGPEEALRRIDVRSGADEHRQAFEKRQFLERVRAIYLAIADERFVVVDGSPEAETVARRIIDDVESTFSAG